jgi:hypothetical protein
VRSDDGSGWVGNTAEEQDTQVLTIPGYRFGQDGQVKRERIFGIENILQFQPVRSHSRVLACRPAGLSDLDLDRAIQHFQSNPSFYLSEESKTAVEFPDRLRLGQQMLDVLPGGLLFDPTHQVPGRLERILELKKR